MITKEQLIKWATQYQEGDNYQSDPDYFDKDKLKHKLLEAKMLVDRWDNWTTDIIVHSSHKEMFRGKLGEDVSTPSTSPSSIAKEAEKLLSLLPPDWPHHEIDAILAERNKEKSDHLWGANIHYSDNISPNQGMMIARNPDGSLQNEDQPGNCIAIFPM